MPVSPPALAEAGRKARGGAGEIEFFAQLVFQEALKAEMQGRLLVGEQKKCGWGRFCLRDVVDAHGARLWRAAALEIDVFLEPAIQIRRGDPALAGNGLLINQRIQLCSALAGFRGEKNNGRVAEELQLPADHFFIIEKQFALVQVIKFVLFIRAALRSALGGGCVARTGLPRAFRTQAPSVHSRDSSAAGFPRVACDVYVPFPYPSLAAHPCPR